MVIDVENNELWALIPTWTMEPQNLVILSLCSNRFNNSIPQLCYLSNLQLLNLSSNDLSEQYLSVLVILLQ